MKELSINILKLIVVWAIVVLFVASYGRSAYSNTVHPHDELALVGYILRGAQSERAFFVRILSMPLRISMQALGGGHLRVCWFPFVPVC